MRIYVVILVTIIASSCSPQLISVPPSTQIPLSTDISPITTTPASEQDRMASLAIADLATRLSLDPKLIHVLSIDLVEWPDTSLGCPRLGEASAEQAEPGYLIVLEVNRQFYEYQTDMGETIFLCDSDSEANSPIKDLYQNVVDGWPNETRDKDVIFMTPVTKP